jgi:hypothetical protein
MVSKWRDAVDCTMPLTRRWRCDQRLPSPEDSGRRSSADEKTVRRRPAASFDGLTSARARHRRADGRADEQTARSMRTVPVLTVGTADVCVTLLAAGSRRGDYDARRRDCRICQSRTDDDTRASCHGTTTPGAPTRNTDRLDSRASIQPRTKPDATRLAISCPRRDVASNIDGR